MSYSFWGLRELTIRSELGHIQCTRSGYSTHQSVDPQKYWLDPPRVTQISRVLSSEPHVTRWSKRLGVTGILTNGNQSTIFLGQGIEPNQEAKISATIRVLSGSNLSSTSRRTVTIGRALADALAIKVGDRVTLLVNTVSGGMNAMDMEVVGIISNGVKEFDDKIVRMNLSDAQELVETDQVERIIVLLDKTELTPSVVKILTNRLASADVTLQTWDQLADYYHQVKTVYGNIFSFIKVIILVIVVLGISNTMSMSVMERIGEIGTLRSIGTSKWGIVGLFIAEGFVLGVIGGILAIGAGIGCAGVINWCGGIYMPPPPGHTEGYTIFIKIYPRVLQGTMLLSMGAATLSSVLPAIKAANMTIVSAIRHV